MTSGKERGHAEVFLTWKGVYSIDSVNRNRNRSFANKKKLTFANVHELSCEDVVALERRSVSIGAFRNEGAFWGVVLLHCKPSG